MCVCRIGQTIPERSPVANTPPVESKQPALQDDHYYSTVGDVQQQMLVLSGDDSAYEFLSEHDQKSLQEDDRAYSNIDISQQEEVVTSGKPGYSKAPRAATNGK